MSLTENISFPPLDQLKGEDDREKMKNRERGEYV
jgi:hypothetical protein